MIRPTATVFWLPVIVLHLHWLRPNEKLKCLLKLAVVGCCTMFWSAAVDRYFYAKWIFVQYRFLLFNVLEGKSAIFGTQPWHWYLSEGVPVILFSLLPSFLIGGLKVTNHKALYFVSLWYIMIHSMLRHKELRYIFPVVPFACIYAGYHLNSLWNRHKHTVYRCLVVLVLASNIPMALYFSLVHHRGSLTVMDELRLAIDNHPSPSILFLTPCYSTPYYSHIHRNVSMRMLTCWPFEKNNELEQFHNNPHQWLNSQYPSPEDLPTHLVLYNSLKPMLEQFLTDNHYNKISEVFYTQFVDEDGTGQYLQVYVKEKTNYHQ
ncbi:GPI mannosyltransferase 3-like [Dysidea avara]|uniref:GPI mannosyltransferase 3-like n=1 Tax=Dysidea avara TaxID=196820 RepID=UPI00332BD980